MEKSVLNGMIPSEKIFTVPFKKKPEPHEFDSACNIYDNASMNIIYKMSQKLPSDVYGAYKFDSAGTKV